MRRQSCAYAALMSFYDRYQPAEIQSHRLCFITPFTSFIFLVLCRFLRLGSFEAAVWSSLRPAEVLGDGASLRKVIFRSAGSVFSDESAGMWGELDKSGARKKKNVLSLCSAAALVTELS